MSDTISPTIANPVEADVYKDLAIFQARYPLRSQSINGRSWVFRRTPGKSAHQCPIVMLPGIQGGGDIFFQVVLALGDRLPIVTVNAPDIEDATTMVAETAGFLAALKLPRVNLVGSSLGGYLAQKFALDFPDRVEQLAIANGFIDIEPFRATAPPASSLLGMDAAAIVAKNVGDLLASPSLDDGQVRLKAAVKTLVGPAQTLENYKSRMLLMMSATQLAAPLISPDRVTIVDDDLDPMIPPAMRAAVRERFDRSEQHAIDGGGHLPAIQRPTVFADILRRRLMPDADSTN
jgi:maspardin